jgi:hypothetical protein
MANWHDDVERAREDARRAREDADRLRRDARELGRRLAREARQAAREVRHAGRGRGPGFSPIQPASEPSETGDVRVEEALALEGVFNVSVEQGAGKLTIRACADGEAPGVVSTGRAAPRIEIQRDGDRLRINIPQNKTWILRRRSGPTTEVRLLPGLASLRVNLGYGDLAVRSLAAESVKLDAGAGTMSTFAVVGSLRGNVGAGKMMILAHEGVASVNVGTGDVQLDIARVVDGEYKIDVGMGRVEVRLPAGAQIHLETSSGIGKTTISFPSAAEGALSVLKASAGIGEVSVKERSPQPAPPPQGTPKPQRPGTAPNRHETEELRILQMLEQGKISSQDAADLIAALRGAAPLAADDGG